MPNLARLRRVVSLMHAWGANIGLDPEERAIGSELNEIPSGLTCMMDPFVVESVKQTHRSKFLGSKSRLDFELVRIALSAIQSSTRYLRHVRQ